MVVATCEKTITEQILEQIDIESGDWKAVLAKLMTRKYLAKLEDLNLEYNELALMAHSYFDGSLDTLRIDN